MTCSNASGIIMAFANMVIVCYIFAIRTFS